MLTCKPDGENARLEALKRYNVLDTVPEEAFDRIVRLAARVLQMPFAMVSLVDRDRVWFKARHNVPAQESPRSGSFCTHTIEGIEPFIVSDAQTDPRFADNPVVTGNPHIRFYIGVPLRTRDGYNLGSLCTLDTEARTLTPEQVELLSDLARLVVDEMELRLVAATDSLTGAMTRRCFLESAATDVNRAQRHHKPLSCVVIDMDRYKSINDTYGHSAGDLVLLHVVSICKSVLRQSDYLGRMGGEEFAIMLPETDAGGAFAMAERLRTALTAASISISAGNIRVTASFGIAQLKAGDTGAEELLQHADKAMYEAKRAGGNRTAAREPMSEISGAGYNYLRMSA